jgi:hypothetical protein
VAQTTKSFLGIIESLRPAITCEEKADWSNVRARAQAHQKTVTHFERDVETLRLQALGLLTAGQPIQIATGITSDLLRQWHLNDSPTLTAIVCWSIAELEITLEPDLLQAVLLSAVLGEVEQDTLYHNNMHFRKVLLQVIRQIAMHNQLFENTPRALSGEQAGLLLLTACIHDIGHDGTGNMVRGVFKQSRLELRSINILEPYLAVCGIKYDDPRGQAIRTMILATDVTPISDAGNPVNQMKAAYRFHFLGDRQKVDSLHLDKDLRVLQKNPQLTLMSLLLHEADIATSAGLTYEITQFETILYRLEVCDDAARPRHVLDFLKNICQRHFLSDAGQKLYGANLARIFAQVETDESHGNEIFGSVESSLFLSGKPSVYSQAKGRA